MIYGEVQPCPWPLGPTNGPRRLGTVFEQSLPVRLAEDAAGGGVAIDGNEFQRAPKFTGSASLDWRPLDRLRLNGSLRHNSPYYSDDANSPNRRIGKATKIDARASYEFGSVTLFGYARNLLDNFTMTYLFSRTVGTAGDPREVGIGIEAKF